MDRDEVEVHKNAKKKRKNEANDQPSWPDKVGRYRIYYIAKKIRYTKHQEQLVYFESR